MASESSTCPSKSHFESILTNINGFGRFQKVLVLLGLCSSTLSGFFINLVGILTYVPHYHQEYFTSKDDLERRLAALELASDQSLKNVSGKPNNFFISLEYAQFLATINDTDQRSIVENMEAHGQFVQLNCRETGNLTTTGDPSPHPDFTLTYYGSRVSIPPSLTSAVMHYGFTCEDKSSQATIGMCVFLGIATGAVVNGITSDVFGRRKSLLLYTTGLCVTATVVLGLLCPNADALGLGSSGTTLFFLGQYLIGLCGISSYMTILILINELVGKDSREKAQFISLLGFELAAVLMVVLYFLPFWSDVFLAFGLVSMVLIVLIYSIIPESPRYLMKTGCDQEAAAVLAHLRQVNSGKVGLFLRNRQPFASSSLRQKTTSDSANDFTQSGDFLVRVPPPTQKDASATASSSCSLQTRETDRQFSAPRAADSSSKPKSWTVIFTDRSYLLKFAIVAFAWLALNLSYYSFSSNILNVPGVFWKNIFKMVFFQMVSYPVGYFLLKKLSRRQAFVFWFGFTCAILVVLLIWYRIPSEAQILAEDGDSGEGRYVSMQFWHTLFLLPVTALYMIIFMLAVELFDTEIRGRAISLASVFARVVASITPSITLYCTSINNFTFMYVLLLGLCSCQLVTVWFLPETKGQDLK